MINFIQHIGLLIHYTLRYVALILHRPHKVLGHLLQGEIHGKH